MALPFTPTLVVPATWAVSTSDQISGIPLFTLLCPMTINPTGARVEFNVSVDGASWYTVTDQTGAPVLPVIPLGGSIALIGPSWQLPPCPWLRLRIVNPSDLSSAVQTSERRFVALGRYD
jgi:hypothetical protein